MRKGYKPLPRQQILEYLEASRTNPQLTPILDQFVSLVCSGRLRMPGEKGDSYSHLSPLAKAWQMSAERMIRVACAIGIAVVQIEPENNLIRVLDHTRLRIEVRTLVNGHMEYHVEDTYASGKARVPPNLYVFESTIPEPIGNTRRFSIVSSVSRAMQNIQRIQEIDTYVSMSIQENALTTVVIQEQKTTKTDAVVREQQLNRQLDDSLWAHNNLSSSSSSTYGQGAPRSSYFTTPLEEEINTGKKRQNIEVRPVVRGIRCIQINGQQEVSNVLHTNIHAAVDGIREQCIHELRQIIGITTADEYMNKRKTQRDGKNGSTTQVSQNNLAYSTVGKSGTFVPPENEPTAVTRMRDNATTFLNTLWKEIKQRRLEATGAEEDDEEEEDESCGVAQSSATDLVPSGDGSEQDVVEDRFPENRGSYEAPTMPVDGCGLIEGSAETEPPVAFSSLELQYANVDDESIEEDETVRWVRLQQPDVMATLFSAGIVKYDSYVDYVTTYNGLPKDACESKKGYEKFRKESMPPRKDGMPPKKDKGGSGPSGGQRRSAAAGPPRKKTKTVKSGEK
jgi:hypothetical protein